jgi:hypothetical protein
VYVCAVDFDIGRPQYNKGGWCPLSNQWLARVVVSETARHIKNKHRQTVPLVQVVELVKLGTHILSLAATNWIGQFSEVIKGS